MSKYKYHPDHTEPTNPKAIFVFGSNLAGRHGRGAALLAAQKYGALRTVEQGLCGYSYAIPTKDECIRTLSLSAINVYASAFIYFAKAHPEMEFFMTRIGCVLAGYEDSQIAPMFKDAPTNINFPEQWAHYLEN